MSKQERELTSQHEGGFWRFSIANWLLHLLGVEVETKTDPSLENLRNYEGVILLVVAPHTSHVNSLLVKKAVEELWGKERSKNLSFIAKKAYWDKPFLRRLVKLIIPDMQFIEKLADINDLIEIYQNKKKMIIVIYPQGSRKNWDKHPLESGFIALADDLDAKVVPVTLLNSEYTMPPGEGPMAAIRKGFIRCRRGEVNTQQVVFDHELVLPAMAGEERGKKDRQKIIDELKARLGLAYVEDNQPVPPFLQII